MERIQVEIDKFRLEITEMFVSDGLVVINRIVHELAVEHVIEASRDTELRFEDKLIIFSEGYSMITVFNN